MYKNKFGDRNNIAGINVARIRKERKMSQQELAVRLQNINHDVGKNCIQEMESGIRFVTDIELIALSKVLNVSIYELLETRTSNTSNYNKEEGASGIKEIAEKDNY